MLGTMKMTVGELLGVEDANGTRGMRGGARFCDETFQQIGALPCASHACRPQRPLPGAPQPSSPSYQSFYNDPTLT